MDLALLIAFAFAIIILIIICTLFIRNAAGKQRKDRDVHQVAAPQNRQMRRVIGNRNIRRRVRDRVGVEDSTYEENGSIHDDEEANDASIEEVTEVPVRKIGTKKKAKLEAKAQKRALTKTVMLEKEKHKQEEEKRQKERDKEREEEREEELRKEEAARKERQLKEQEEHERYLKLKEMFSIEEEGFQEDQEVILADIKDYIKSEKVVYVDDVAARFSLKTGFVVTKVLEWQKTGELTGVIDDHGTILYITEEQLENVAKFIERRGRVSLAELCDVLTPWFA